MILPLPKLIRRLWPAGLALASLATASAQQPARRPTPKIEFTEPAAAPANAITNGSVGSFSGSGQKRSGPGALDQSVRKPFDFFEEEDSFSGVPAHPPRNGRSSPLNSKRARELQDRKRNWVFSTPEEIYGLPTAEQILNVPEYGPNGEEKELKTTLERYFERMEKNRAEVATNNAKSDRLPEWLKPDGSGERAATSNDDSERRPSLFGAGWASSPPTPAQSELGGSLGSAASPTEKSYNEFFNLRGGDAYAKPLAPNAAQTQRMQDFKQLLETRSAFSPGGSGLGGGLNFDASGGPGGASLKSPFAGGMMGRDSFSPEPAPRPSLLPSLAPVTALPGASTPGFSPPPAASAARSFTPPASVFELPKRKF